MKSTKTQTRQIEKTREQTRPASVREVWLPQLASEPLNQFRSMLTSLRAGEDGTEAVARVGAEVHQSRVSIASLGRRDVDVHNPTKPREGEKGTSSSHPNSLPPRKKNEARSRLPSPPHPVTCLLLCGGVRQNRVERARLFSRGDFACGNVELKFCSVGDAGGSSSRKGEADRTRGKSRERSMEALQSGRDFSAEPLRSSALWGRSS